MIKPSQFIKILKKNRINFFAGVPDSLFASLCNYFQIYEKKNHILSTNEGSAVGLAIGYHLATGKVPLVYLQNSGLGNVINPAVSLSDKKIFNIPIFFLIGWRGELNKNNIQIKDEPQHKTQGQITKALLKILNIKFEVLNSKSNYVNIINRLSKYSKKNNKPVAILIRKNSFAGKKNIQIKKKNNFLTREIALQTVFDCIPKNIPKVSTTGMLSRELYEMNKKIKKEKNTFMCIGGMGHAISITSGLAMVKNKRKIICLDGDGSSLMHFGAMAVSAKMKNIIHIVFNNHAHDSVGGQIPPSENLEFYKMSRQFGYSHSYKVNSKKEIVKKIKFAIKNKNNTFIEISCIKGHRDNLLRPSKEAEHYKKIFMKFIKEN